MPLQDATATKMLNNVTEFVAATLAKPDPSAWEQLLIYCPREVIERRLASQADWKDNLKQTNVNECPFCQRMFVDGETCSRGGCPMGGDF